MFSREPRRKPSGSITIIPALVTSLCKLTQSMMILFGIKDGSVKKNITRKAISILVMGDWLYNLSRMECYLLQKVDMRQMCNVWTCLWLPLRYLQGSKYLDIWEDFTSGYSRETLKNIYIVFEMARELVSTQVAVISIPAASWRVAAIRWVARSISHFRTNASAVASECLIDDRFLPPFPSQPLDIVRGKQLPILWNVGKVSAVNPRRAFALGRVLRMELYYYSCH